MDLLVLRGVVFLYNYLYYKRQGVPFLTPVLPFFGNFLSVVRVTKENPKRDYVPFGPLLDDQYGVGKNPPDIVGAMMQSQAIVVLNSARVMTDVYLTKNKYFDKDPMSQVLFGSLFGESIVLAAGDELWNRKRKVLSSAFYKEKLVKMTEQIRAIVAEKIAELERNNVAANKPIDVIKEMGDI